MQIAGNILLILSLLAAGGLGNMTFFQKMRGGSDARMGHALSMLFLIAVFWGCMALVACIIGLGGGYSWLSLGRFGSGECLALSFLTMLLGANLGMEASFTTNRFLGRINAVATALVLMVAFAILLNESLKLWVLPMLIKNSLVVVLALNIMVLAPMLWRAVIPRIRTFLRRLALP